MTEVSFGEWLKRQRMGRGLTREQLAHQIGCAVITLRKIEAEERRPSAQMVERLAEIFEIPQNEQTSFLKYARGDWRYAPGDSIKETPWRAASPPRTNLPAPLTSFIGREKEQAEVIELLAKNRLVTLTGAGGIGKTRLSIQVGQNLLSNFPHGTWLIELAPILDPLLVPRTTAISIGLRDEPQRPVIDMLCDYLRDKRMLIILDNCEHLIEACASITDKLVHTAPNVHILATSREALGIPGEVNYRLPSLGVPDAEHLLPVESLSQCEAVTLFIERAKSAIPNFIVTNENASALAQICHQLDGIPLAIELAAAKTHVLSLEQIAKRLDDRFRLLTSGSRVALERHQTLRTAIDWSYNLLSQPEQSLFRRVSVFIAGWTLEAAESVCTDKLVRRDDVLNLLEQLINKSLVIMEASEGEPRYRMLETIRQYANEKLIEAGEGDALRDKHLKYFLDLAEIADPHLRRTEQVEWLKRLDGDHDNLRAALTWAMSKPSAEQTLRLAGALGNFWTLRDYHLEGAKWLDQALGKSWNEHRRAEKAVRAKALYRRADLAETLDELDIEKTSAEAALALCEELGDLWGIAYSRLHVALSQSGFGIPAAVSKVSLEKSVNDFQSLGDAWGEALALSWLAMVITWGEGTREEFSEIQQRFMARVRIAGDRERLALFLSDILDSYSLEVGDWDEAERLYQEVEQLYKELDSSYGINLMRIGRTVIFFARGDLEKTKTEAMLAIEHLDRVGERNHQSITLSILALIEEAENDLPSAVVHAEKALKLAKEIGTGEVNAFDLAWVGILKYKQGNVEEAMKYIRDGLWSVQKGETNQLYVANIFVQLAGVLVEKKTQIAVQILAFADFIVPSSAIRKDPLWNKLYFDRFLSTARAKLGEEEFTAAWEAGSKMTLQEAIDLVLKTLEASDTLERGQG